MLTSAVPTTETLAFVQAHLPPGTLRILEVGCGDGALAVRLQALGLQVIALDASADAVAKARARGVDARLVQWPEFMEAPFDAVLFTRSLHHIGPLARAIVRAKELLKAQGKVLVEDFAFGELEPLAVEWLYHTLAVLEAAHVLRQDGDGFATQVLRREGSLAAWKAAREQHLHSWETMAACLGEHFPYLEAANAPYLYRYVCTMLEDDEDGYHVASRVLELEKRYAGSGRMSLIGRRLVGRRSTASGAGGRSC